MTIEEQLKRMGLERKPFRAGDYIQHQPSGEEWVLACDEEPYGDTTDVICCGWPETIARGEHCMLVEAASDERRLDYLQRVAKQCAGQLRGSRAASQLARVDLTDDHDQAQRP